MGNKKTSTLWLIAGTIIAVIFFLPILFSDYQKYAVHLIEQAPYVAPFIIVVFRFVCVVAAPLPGAPIAFASMAVLPWYEAWIWNFIGAESGAITAFFIARKFREPIVTRFAPLEKIHEWQDKISQRRQFWSFTGFRLVSLVAFDFVSYAAGLTKLPFWIFITATFLIDIPAGLLFFYFGGLAVQYSIAILAIFAALCMIPVLTLNRLRTKETIEGVP